MAAKKPNTGLFVGLNKGHVTTPKELAPRPSARKGEYSAKNNDNRAKAKYVPVQGSKSFSETQYNKTKPVEVSETQTQQASSNYASVDEHSIVKEVLGERSAHIHRVRRITKGTSRSEASAESTAASRAPIATCQSFESATLSAQFACYEAKLQHMTGVMNNLIVIWNSKFSDKGPMQPLDLDDGDDEEDLADP